MIPRRTALALPLLLRALLPVLLPWPARALAWPSRPVRLVVPFGAVGATDIFARTVADRIGPALGGRAFVENRPGAGATLGPQMVARATDGHTLLVITSSHTIGETLLPNRGYVLAGISPRSPPSTPPRSPSPSHPACRRATWRGWSRIPGRIPARSPTRRPASARRTTWSGS
ncbi:MAG: hypothetical protein K2X49_24495 [Acetobacteraceae bacterium]|nr:hypothetical protein [Acetobacteraceae bacterium]